MNILFVLYGDFSSNSVNPLALYAREFQRLRHHSCVAVPANLQSLRHCPDPAFRPALYEDVLSDPTRMFPDGRPADVIHAWTPREAVRQFVTTYMAQHPTPLVVYLEDHEYWIARQELGVDEETLLQQTEADVSERMPSALSHPFRYDSFIGLADAAVIIQDKLRSEVPPWVPCTTVMPPVDLEFFSPRAPDPALRAKYGVARNEQVIVYPGGLNAITRIPIQALAMAVCLINERGVPCRLLRTGPFALDFIDRLPPHFASFIVDLGVVDRREMPDLLALADVFVQPGSADPFEDLRLPGKLPELLAMGRAVVMPDINIAHLLDDGVDVVLTRTGTAGEIADRCLELFSDPVRAKRIGQAGRRFAEQNFDAQTQAARMTSVHAAARDNFDPTTAAEVWNATAMDVSPAALVARKLASMAETKARPFHPDVRELLSAHARYIERMQSRVQGLEARIRVREAQVSRLSMAAHEDQVQTDLLHQSLAALESSVAELRRDGMGQEADDADLHTLAAQRDD